MTHEIPIKNKEVYNKNKQGQRHGYWETHYRNEKRNLHDIFIANYINDEFVGRKFVRFTSFNDIHEFYLI